jgi:hypothetical protein
MASNGRRFGFSSGDVPNQAHSVLVPETADARGNNSNDGLDDNCQDIYASSSPTAEQNDIDMDMNVDQNDVQTNHQPNEGKFL